MRTLGKRLLKLWLRWERHINLAALALGFAFDLWLAKRPDSVADNILLVTYLFICAGVIITLNIQKLRRQLERERPTETLILLIVLQFCFGGLANNMLILYGKSGTFGGSLLFLGLLAAFALGNEFLKGRYDQLRFNVGIYYFLLLTYCVIAVPTFILHAIGVQVFLASITVSVVLIGVFLSLLFLLAFRKRQKRQMIEVSLIVAAILAVFNIFYFLNIIPPVPLSLKDIGIYHTLERNDAGNFDVSFEKPAWYVFWRDTASTYTFVPGEAAYCFSAVFAPGKLSAPIVHVWEKYDPEAKDWTVQSTYSFSINGGRAQGYRGWSVKRLSEGQWRCDVETAKGELIGRISFDAVEGKAMQLSTTTL